MSGIASNGIVCQMPHSCLHVQPTVVGVVQQAVDYPILRHSYGITLLQIWEDILIALRAIRVHKLRAVLTTLGIIIGITSVTSMVTIINGIEQQFEKEMSELGSDVLYIEKWPWMSGPGTKWWIYRNRPRITEELVDVIQKRSRYATAVAPVVTTSRPVRAEGETIRNVYIEASSPEYEKIHSVKFHQGRFYNDLEHRTSRNVAVIGYNLAQTLFPVQNPIGKTIRIGGYPFRVIGVLEKRGTGQGDDNWWDVHIKIPFNTFKSYYGTSNRDASIRVKVASADLMPAAQDELRGILRAARKVDAREDDNFEINTEKALQDQLAPVKMAIYGIGIFLTALSLIVGGIGVMNIMFVSVKERTREIGIRKAIGARRKSILTQFLVEAVVLCLVGGTVAITISMMLTGVIKLVMPAYLPFSTILMSFGICVLIGVIFGLAPAWTAARSEPIEALRYE